MQRYKKYTLWDTIDLTAKNAKKLCELWESFGNSAVKIKRVNIYFLLIETNKCILCNIKTVLLSIGDT